MICKYKWQYYFWAIKWYIQPLARLVQLAASAYVIIIIIIIII